MDNDTQTQLITEILDLREAKRPFLDDKTTSRPSSNYTSPERFEAEKQRIFQKLPYAAAHVSELAGEHAFIRASVAGTPIILTRGADGVARAFLNVCRHRAMRLVADDAGCARRFTCPYHAWTYSNTGELLAAPHFDSGFGELDKGTLGLHTLPCIEKFGFIWVSLGMDEPAEIERHLAPMEEDMAALDMAHLRIAEETTQVFTANWKTLIEGGLEAYHFRVAHRDTIGPYFEDNLSTYQVMGPHIRSVLPRMSLSALAGKSMESWHLRDHANLLYTLFPSTQLLVQQDHVVWIRSNPLSAGETELRLVTLAPATLADDDPRDTAYWSKNHRITMDTLAEDFVIGEAIQESHRAVGHEQVIFGRFEGALEAVNNTIERYLDE